MLNRQILDMQKKISALNKSKKKRRKKLFFEKNSKCVHKHIKNNFFLKNLLPFPFIER